MTVWAWILVGFAIAYCGLATWAASRAYSRGWGDCWDYTPSSRWASRHGDASVAALRNTATHDRMWPCSKAGTCSSSEEVKRERRVRGEGS